MNSASRCVVLSMATCVLTTALYTNASGQQPQRRGVGNSAEVERLERERRDREMREADMSERQYLLRTMEPDRRPAEPPAPRLAVTQIRADFVRLQVLNNDLARAVARGEALNLKLVSKSVAEIKKLATRLRDNLVLPEPDGEGPPTKATAVAPLPAKLEDVLTALDGSVLKFVDDVASRGVYLLDAHSSAKARHELEAIIELSAQVKKSFEGSSKSNQQPR